MGSPADLDPLKSSVWGRLMDWVERFEQAWRDAGSADPAAFLPPPDDPLRPSVLHELIKSDLEIRWRRGQPVRLEHYLEKFPELGPAGSLAPELIFEEYRARERFGDRPPLADYRGRFPDQYDRLQRLVVEQATDLPGGTTPPSKDSTAPAVAAPNVLLQLGGDYKLLRRLGSGSFAEVWLAEAPGGVRVAIKRLFQPMDTEEARRELGSLELIKHLHHTYLLQVHAFWLKDNRLHIALELADSTLRDRLRQCRAEGQAGIPLAELLGYFREAAEALDFLHARKVWHRDVKPENLLLLGGHAKVGDFGLARAHASQRLSNTAGAGTPAFMPPEVWRGRGHPHSDQYSLALTYAFLRNGQLPFAGQNLAELMYAHLEKAPDLAPLPEAEQQVLLRGLAKDPGQRYPSCRELVRALEQAVAPELRKTNPELFLPAEPPGLPPSRAEGAFTTIGGADSSPSGPGLSTPVWRSGEPFPPPGPAVARPWRWFAVGAVAGVLLLAAVAWLFFGRAPSPPFTLIKPVPLSVIPGRGQALTIQVQRRDFHGPIRLTFADLPPGVRVADAVIAEGTDGVPIEVIAAPDARPGGPLRVRAEGGGSTPQETTLELTIGEPAYALPGEWGPAPDAELMNLDGRWYYDRIDRIWEGVAVRFLLVPADRKQNLRTFYIMENKVWVELYRKHAPMKGPDRHPATGMQVEEAHRFAEALGGKLPLPEQLDKAAGRFEPGHGRGPFREPVHRYVAVLHGTPEAGWPGALLGVPLDHLWFNEIAIQRSEPMPVGTATHDVSPDPFGRPGRTGCRDLSGNGLEWTREVRSISKPLERRFLPIADPAGDEFVPLRGYRFTRAEPLLFEYLDKPMTDSLYPGIGKFDDKEVDYGFRVVIEP